jgi:hypothetical protein
LCAAGTKAIAAQNWSSRRRLERHCVWLAALIANDLKSFAFVTAATSAGLLWSAEILTARVTARFASLRVTQAPLAIIVLLSFSKWEGISTLGASDVQIRH